MNLIEEYKSCETDLRDFLDATGNLARKAELNNMLAVVMGNRDFLEQEDSVTEDEKKELVLDLVGLRNRIAVLSIHPNSAGKHDIILKDCE